MDRGQRRRRVIVTGATSGIGRATAIQAAAAGADVAFCANDARGADATLAEIEAAGGTGYFHLTDLADESATRDFARAAIAQLGGLDGLVNNAGANFLHGVAGATKADIQACFDLNFYAQWAMAQEARAALKESGGGMIVNVASIHARHTIPGFFPYNVSKAMVVALTTSIAIEWGRDNIQCVAVAPGIIRTEAVNEYLERYPDPDAALAEYTRVYPLGRAGHPDDVASLIVYLLSGQNRFMSGTTVYVDGGLGVIDPEATYEDAG
jgi:NAD(P)-dependent dehydrogenase (short-subunit alcohol dehydrogenase family)